ncbi:hypothetical protein [Tautonia marina]|uniref:hypothetical protein n=1 Tax=Tautonia marina TaxID=2653855 RepID=UPI0013755CC7|nr:hypothetical protein [Tautonia marina]
MPLSPGSAFKWLAAIVVVLTAISGLIQFLSLGLGHNRLLGFARLFDVGLDANVPTWWSSLALTLCAALMVLIGAEHRRRGDSSSRSWWFLAAIVCFLSIDETAVIHERVGNSVSVMLQELLTGSSIWGGAYWIYAYLIPGIILSIVYLRFYFRLPTRTRWLVTLGGGALVTGGVVCEALAHHLLRPSLGEVAYQVMTIVEEFLEMIGVVILVSGLLDYIHLAFGGLTLSLDIRHAPAQRAVADASHHDRQVATLNRS